VSTIGDRLRLGKKEKYAIEDANAKEKIAVVV
jgi:hypothetical protein